MLCDVMNGGDNFTRFEHAGWERVADKYNSVWSSLTRQFIPHLISAAQVSPSMSVLGVRARLCFYGSENVGRCSNRNRFF
jgi:hypothetical protein